MTVPGLNGPGITTCHYQKGHHHNKRAGLAFVQKIPQMLTIVLIQAVLLVQLGLIMKKFYREMSAVLVGNGCYREDITGMSAVTRMLQKI